MKNQRCHRLSQSYVSSFSLKFSTIRQKLDPIWFLLSFSATVLINSFHFFAGLIAFFWKFWKHSMWFHHLSITWTTFVVIIVPFWAFPSAFSIWLSSFMALLLVSSSLRRSSFPTFLLSFFLIYRQFVLHYVLSNICKKHFQVTKSQMKSKKRKSMRSSVYNILISFLFLLPYFPIVPPTSLGSC